MLVGLQLDPWNYLESLQLLQLVSQILWTLIDWIPFDSVMLVFDPFNECLRSLDPKGEW